jgi:hypothetical protein
MRAGAAAEMLAKLQELNPLPAGLMIKRTQKPIGHRLMKLRTVVPASQQRLSRWHHSPRAGGVNERKPRTCRGF